MKKEIDILDEVRSGIREERRIYIVRLLLIALIVFCVLSVCVLSFLSFREHKKKEMMDSQANKLEMLKTNITYIAQNINNKNLSKEEIVEFKYNLDNNLKEMRELFHNSHNIYAVKAGLILANIAINKGEYSDAIYYFKKISDNTKLDASIRDYTKFLLLQTTLSFENSSHQKIVSEIDEYFASKTDNVKSTIVKVIYSSAYNKYATSYFGVPFKLLRGLLVMDQKKYDVATSDFKDVVSIVERNQMNSMQRVFSSEKPIALLIARENIAYINYLRK